MIREGRRLTIGFSLLVVMSIVFAASPVLAGVPPYPLSCPEPDFTADPTGGYAPLQVQFTDQTEFGACAFATLVPGAAAFAQSLSKDVPVEVFGRYWRTIWDFGDGSTFVGVEGDDPTHVYTRPGRYDVTLTYEWVFPEAFGIVLPYDVLSLLNQVVPEEIQVTVTKELYISVLAREEEKDEAPPEPAKMLSAHLDVNPTEVVPGQEVIVSANVCNSGGQSGVKTATLFVNGTAEQSQTVGVGPGGCTTVVFRVSKGAPGTYQVNVDGMQGAFSVLAPRIVQKNVPSQQDTGIGTAGLIAMAVVLVVLVLAVVMILKKD